MFAWIKGWAAFSLKVISQPLTRSPVTESTWLLGGSLAFSALLTWSAVTFQSSLTVVCPPTTRKKWSDSKLLLSFCTSWVGVALAIFSSATTGWAVWLKRSAAASSTSKGLAPVWVKLIFHGLASVPLPVTVTSAEGVKAFSAALTRSALAFQSSSAVVSPARLSLNLPELPLW